jgi:hypothetical protein
LLLRPPRIPLELKGIVGKSVFVIRLVAKRVMTHMAAYPQLLCRF